MPFLIPSQSLALPKHSAPLTLKSLKGKITGMGKLPKDNIVDFVAITPTLNEKNLPYFHIDHLHQGDVDKMTVAGRSFKVPSFLSLPKQRERFKGVPFSITLKKETFRAYLLPHEHSFQATHAKVNTRKINRSNLHLLPFLSNFHRLKHIKDLTKDSYVLDYSQNTLPVQYQHHIPIHAHKLDHEMFALSLEKFDNELLISDMKQVKKDKPLNLKTTKKQTPYVLFLIKQKPNPLRLYIPHHLLNMAGEGLPLEPQTTEQTMPQSSYIAAPEALMPHHEFLPLISKPSLSSDSQMLQLEKPKCPRSIKEAGAKVYLWKVHSFYYKKRKISESKELLEELSFPRWPSEVDVSNLSSLSPGDYRWQVVFQGRFRNSHRPQFFTTSMASFKIE